MGDRLLHALFGVPSSNDIELYLRPLADSGCQYPCSQIDLDILRSTNSTLTRALPPPRSHHAAYYRFASDFQAAANYLTHIVATVESLVSVPQTWDLPFKIFNDLDRLFFDHQLQGRVVLCWEIINDADNDILGRTHCPPSGGKAHIALRFNVDWHAYGRHSILGTLLHEMLHAYFYVMCGAPCDYTDPDWEEVEGHGEYWQAARADIESFTGLALVTESRSEIIMIWDVYNRITQRTMTFVLEFLGWDNTPETRRIFQNAAAEREYVALVGGDTWVPSAELRM